MSYLFDGVDDKIQYTGAQWDDGDTDWTASVWVNYDNADNNNGYIIGHWLSSAGWFLRLNGQPSETLRFGVESGTGANEVVGGGLTTDTWQNVVIQYTASTNGIEIFLDGTSIDTGGSSAATQPITDFVIGNRADNDRDFQGLIAEVAGWNSLLSSGEITDLQTQAPSNIATAPNFYVGLATDGDVGAGTVTGAVYNSAHPILIKPSGAYREVAAKRFMKLLHH